MSAAYGYSPERQLALVSVVRQIGSMPRRHLLLATAVAVVWGVNFVIIDVGLRTFPPLLFVALRFTLVALPAVFFVRRPPISARQLIAVGTFLSAGQFALLFTAMHVGLPAGLASLVIQLQAVFTVVLAVAVFGERPGAWQLGGCALAFGGIALIAVARSGHGLPAGALLLAVGAAASWGIGNIVTRVAKAPSAISLLVWSSLVPPLPLLVLSLALEGAHRDGEAFAHVGPGAVGALLYVVVAATAFGFGSWTWLLRRHPASRVAPFALLVPVVGIGSAWLALGERPGALELVGAAVVLCGLGLVSAALRPGPRPRPRPAAAGPPPSPAPPGPYPSARPAPRASRP